MPITAKLLEKDIVRQICDWMALKQYFFWRSNNIPVFDRKRATFRALPKYTPRGLPDIICIHRAKFIGIEVKVPGYWKYTDDQKAIKAKIEANGGYYFLCTSLEEVQEAFALLDK